MNQLTKIEEAVAYIEGKIALTPTIGLILGSGLGDLAGRIEDAVHIPYEEIPHFPTSTVAGHQGQLVIGQLAGRSVLAMQGRFHYYEGYSMQEVVFPVYVMKRLGIQVMLVTNACGGMNRSLAPGDLVIIRDHLNLTGANPLIGYNHPELGVRFPDMSQAYTPELIRFVEEQAKELDIKLGQGVYAGISGPTYMTSAELIMLARLGADLVGMSTVPEVIAASHASLMVIGISCVTDMAIGGEVEPLTHEQVVEVANRTKPKFISLVTRLVAEVDLA